MTSESKLSVHGSASRSRTMRNVVILLAAASIPTVFCAVPAHAETPVYEVAFTGIGIYPRSEPDMLAPHVGPALPDGTELAIECETTGVPADNGSGLNAIWEQLRDGTFLPNAYVQTGSDSWTAGIPQCNDGETATALTPTKIYNRTAADTFARMHVNDVGRIAISPDCAWYASEILWSGGLPKSSDWTDKTTDPTKSVAPHWAWTGLPTKAAMSANDLFNYLLANGLATKEQVSYDNLILPDAEVGDLLFYVWDTTAQPNPSSEVMDHVAVVSQIGGSQTRVAQHTPAAIDKGWNWSMDANDWLSNSKPHGTAYLLHINY